MSAPLLGPKPIADWDGETREIILGNADALPGEGRVLNVYATLAHHPKLMKRWLVFGAHVLAKSTLPERDRELVILRTGWNCRSPYEWGQHVVIARAAGITDEEIERVAQGPSVPGWDQFDALLLRAADELHHDSCLSEETYRALAKVYDDQQMLDLVFTVGQYHIVSMALNSFRVQRDDGVKGVRFPERA